MFTNYVINIYIKHTMLIYHNNHIHRYTYLSIPTHILTHIHTYIYGKDITLTHEMISTVITYIDFIM